MDFVNLRTLIESARLGSFSKAASSLCVTQSAVSRRIKILEDHYGELLLDRSGPVLKPTPMGELLIEKARQMLKIEEELALELKARAHKKKISFCCTVPFGLSYLPDIFRKFMTGHSMQTDLSFVFDMPEAALEGLAKGIFDLVLIEYCENLDLSEFCAFSLPDDEMVFVSAPALGIKVPEIDLGDLSGERFFCKKSSCCSRRFLDKSLQALGQNVKVFSNTVFFDDIPFIIRSVLAGDGFTFVSKSIVAEYLQNGTLVAHHLKGFDRTRPRRLVLNDSRNLDPLVLDFIAGIFAAFGAPVPAELFQAEK